MSALGGNLGLVLLIALIASNYLVTRSSLARRYPALFWVINGVDVVAAVCVLLIGVPGIDGRPLIRVMVALVVLMHLAQNFQARTRWDAEARAERLDAERTERSRALREPSIDQE